MMELCKMHFPFHLIYVNAQTCETQML